MQLYVRNVVASVTRPVKSLQGFRRVHPGRGRVQNGWVQLLFRFSLRFVFSK